MNRDRFEERCVQKFGQWREAGNRANDNGAPLDREALCWRDEKGNYGVLALNAAWWGWRMAMGEVSVQTVKLDPDLVAAIEKAPGVIRPMEPDVRSLYEQIGRRMVEMTTTVRGPDEWLAIPEMWLACMKERDEARAECIDLAHKVSALEARRSGSTNLREGCTTHVPGVGDL